LVIRAADIVIHYLPAQARLAIGSILPRLQNLKTDKA